VRERAQLNRIDPYRIKLPKPEDRKRQILRCHLLYCHHYILSNCIWFGRRITSKMHSIHGVLQMQKCRRKIAHIHKYTATFIPFLSYAYYLSSSPSRFPLSFTHFIFLILLLLLLLLQRVRLNTPVRADKN
jgi:hypothetical protein